MSIVLDASMTLAWHFSGERTPVTDYLRNLVVDRGAVVPAHWAIEVANALLISERRGRSTAETISTFILSLRRLQIEVDPGTPSVAWTSSLPLARVHRLTAYDAAYLELAQRRGLPLATLDRDIARAAKVAGVTLAVAET